jgi:hypothetical protein
MIYYLFGMFSFLMLLYVNLYNHQFDFKIFIMNLSYNFINLVSKFQIYFFKINKELNKIIQQCPLLLTLKNSIISKTIVNDIEIFKDGVPYQEIINDYDFVIYSNNDNGNSEVINKIILDNKSNIFEKYEVSNIKFMLLELNVGNKLSFIINLKNNNYNFYIVGNNFNLKFFEYYVKNIMKKNFLFENDDKITLSILDQNVNNTHIELHPKNQSILLEKTNYKIIY